jgi:D-alanine-D-alanine ligase
MKIAVVYNRDSQSVINLFGLPNREKIGLKTIKRLTDALRKGGHQVIAIEGDKDLVDRLEEFMPRVLKGERPGMVFNVSYGIQGQARYTHVPSILEMVGIPYVASGPLAHSLALDKVVTKMILRQNGLPTPDFVVLENPDMPVPPDLKYPLVVKPKNEAVSFGLRIVHDEAELREGARVIFDQFRQAVLAEQYVEGREVNVGILGNDPPEAFPPVELRFGEGGPAIYTYEDKTGRSGRRIEPVCPAPIGAALTQKAQELAVKAFKALGCADCVRVDMRLDADGELYILEVNSLPSLGEHGSYLVGAAQVGLDFERFVNRLIEVASARYFGTPQPVPLDAKTTDPGSHAFAYLTQRRDAIERRLKEWTELSSRSDDPVGIQAAARRLGDLMGELGMRPAKDLTDPPEVYTWETRQGLEGGTLFVGSLDVPMHRELPHAPFRREPEWLYGEGIGSSRAPLVMLEFALRTLRSARRLRGLPLGVLYYTDEGREAHHSAELIYSAASRAGRVFVLAPGNVGNFVVSNRRGQRSYRLVVEGESLKLGRATRKPEALRWTSERLERCARLTSQKDRVSVSAVDLHTEGFPMHLPHRVRANLLVTYPSETAADALEREIRGILGEARLHWKLERISDRPPMPERRANRRLWRSLESVAQQWEIPLRKEGSAWPSVGGLVPARTACLCGMGPVARDLRTPNEAVWRLSLMQRTLLLAEFLAHELSS